MVKAVRVKPTCFVLCQGETLRQVLDAATRIIGSEVAAGQPLMEAGLDSLGVLLHGCLQWPWIREPATSRYHSK